MKKLYALTVIITVLFLSAPVYSIDDFQYMSIDEYSKFFELGFFDDTKQTDFDESNTEIREEKFTPKLKEKVDITSDVIELERQPVKLNIGKTEFLDSYKEVFKEQTGRNELLKTGNLTLFSDTTEELSNYMTINYKSSMNMKLHLNKNMALQAGQEIWYVNPDASLGSKKFYVNPSLKLGGGVSLNYTGRYNQTSKNIEQEVGLNYSPKLFKDNAKFGVSASTIINDNNEVQSKKIKFSTDLYIF